MKDPTILVTLKSYNLMPRTGDNVHIPLKTDEALAALLNVKPTKNMPRPGNSGKKKSAINKPARKKN